MSFPSDMTAPPAGALEACLALLEKATPGEWDAMIRGDYGDGNEADVNGPDGNEVGGAEFTPPGYGDTIRGQMYETDARAIAAAVNFLRTHGPALLAALRLREGCEGLVDSLPSNWCDPMLTGPTAVIGKPPYGCPEIEALIAAIKQRLRYDLARVLEEGG